jgi:acetyltransferase-like isoleucine patch superfamily enzyme
MFIKYLKELFRPKRILVIYRHIKQVKLHKGISLKLGFNSNTYNSKFGKNVYIGDNCSILNSFIDSHSYCNNNTIINNAEIGKFSSIGSEVVIGVGTHPTDFVTTHPAFYANNKAFNTFSDKMYFDEIGKIEIGNDVWIGSKCTILNNINIGDGAIIAYGAVVTKDVLPYSIVGGVPAKHLKFRFEQSVIQELQKIKWWDLDDKFFKQNYKLFHKPENLIQYYKSNSEAFSK